MSILPDVKKVLQDWFRSERTGATRDSSGPFKRLVEKVAEATTAWRDAARQLGMRPEDIDAAEYAYLQDLIQHARVMVRMWDGVYNPPLPGPKTSEEQEN